MRYKNNVSTQIQGVCEMWGGMCAHVNISGAFYTF